jgi:maltose O-acetyltransferase
LFKSCGRGVVIEANAHIPFHKVEIGNNSGIGPNALLGAVRIGCNVMMGPDVIILSNNKFFASRTVPMCLQGKSQGNPAVIGDDVWIGARAIMLPGVQVGRGAIIGAGAVLSRELPEHAIVAGNFARIVKQGT